MLALIGADDPGVPADEREAFEKVMREGGVDWQMTLYGGVVHSYTNPDADKMNRPEMSCATTRSPTTAPGRKCWLSWRKFSKDADAAAPQSTMGSAGIAFNPSYF